MNNNNKDFNTYKLPKIGLHNNKKKLMQNFAMEGNTEVKRINSLITSRTH